MKPNQASEGKSELRCLGPTSLRGPEGNEILSVLARPKLLALLVYLAAAPRSGFRRREMLAGLFWADLPPDRARAAVRQALYKLRLSLGADAIECRGDEEVRLAPDSFVSDVGRFREALGDGRVEDAVDLYQGSFMEGFFPPDANGFERWLDACREELQCEAARAFLTLAKQEEASENPVGAGHYVRRGLGLCPRDEALFRDGVQLLSRVGDLAGIASLFEEFRSDLQDSLEANPSRETEALVQDLLRGGDRETKTTASAPERAGEVPESAEPPVWTEVESDPSELTLSRAPRGPAFGPVITLAFFVLLSCGILVGLGQGNPRNAPGPEVAMPGYPELAENLHRSKILAVLPFLCIGSDPEGELLAKGIQEELITRLSQTPGLIVISGRALEGGGAGETRVLDLPASLGAGAILNGAVRVEGSRARITVHLTEVPSAEVLWSGAFDREVLGILDIERDLAFQVSRTLLRELPPRQPDDLFRFATNSPEAFEAYLKARGVERGLDDLADLFLEEEYLRRSIAHSPSFPRPLAALAKNFARRARDFGFSSEWRDSAMVVAEGALTLEPDLPDAHLAMAWVNMAEGELPKAIRALSRAIELNPSLTEAYVERGVANFYSGDLYQAIVDFREARSLDPTMSGLSVNIGVSYAMLGNLSSAGSWFRRELARPGVSSEEMAEVEAVWAWWSGDGESARNRLAIFAEEPANHPSLGTLLAVLHLEAGEWRKAEEMITRVKGVEGGPGARYFFLPSTVHGLALIRSGASSMGKAYLEESKQTLLSLVEKGTLSSLPLLEMAGVHSALGDRSAALDWARQAFSGGCRHLELIRRNPLFSELRGDPEFQLLLAEVEAGLREMNEQAARVEEVFGRS